MDFVVGLRSVAKPADFDDLGKSLVCLFESSGGALNVVRATLRKEIEELGK